VIPHLSSLAFFCQCACTAQGPVRQNRFWERWRKKSRIELLQSEQKQKSHLVGTIEATDRDLAIAVLLINYVRRPELYLIIRPIIIHTPTYAYLNTNLAEDAAIGVCLGPYTLPVEMLCYVIWLRYLYSASHWRLSRIALSVTGRWKERSSNFVETQVIVLVASHSRVQEECRSRVQDLLIV